jgi:DNA-binding transcriptional MerR regulator
MKGELSIIQRRLPGHRLDAEVDLPVYPIGVVAEHFGVSGQTLRLYESKGLVRPSRRNGERYYSTCDVRWLACLRHLIHEDKVSVEGVRQLLHLAPCWQVAQNIWVSAHSICRNCPVYLKGNRQLHERERQRSRSVLGPARR